jgi:oligopeptidase B
MDELMHLHRGGSELGQRWQDQGKLLNKKWTFFDFIDAAEYFCDKQYTIPTRLAATGVSAGGLTIGARDS